MLVWSCSTWANFTLKTMACHISKHSIGIHGRVRVWVGQVNKISGAIYIFQLELIIYHDI